MSEVTIGFLFGVGLAAWVYSRMSRYRGGEIKGPLIVAAAAGAFAMLIVIILLNTVIPE